MIGRLGIVGVALGLALVSAPANASTVQFTLDPTSSVTVTDRANGFLCNMTNCGVDASIASGFGGSFELGTGDTETFDFITWTGAGTGGSIFDVSATLVFSEPAESVTGSGGGGVFVIGGYIVAGVLHWTNLPQLLNVGASVFSVDFQDGFTLLPGHSITSSASVTGISVVPLPAALPLFLSGLAGLGALAWRGRAKRTTG